MDPHLRRPPIDLWFLAAHDERCASVLDAELIQGGAGFGRLQRGRQIKITPVGLPHLRVLEKPHQVALKVLDFLGLNSP